MIASKAETLLSVTLFLFTSPATSFEDFLHALNAFAVPSEMDLKPNQCCRGRPFLLERMWKDIAIEAKVLG